MSAQPEVWRVSTVEGIFEADLETLKQWIVEGCVLPTDKVTKGNLSWIEAGRVPKLKDAFNGDHTPPNRPPATESFESDVRPPPSQSTPATTWAEPPKVAPEPVNTTACQNHPDAEPAYVCRMCCAVFCKQCPRFVRDRVPICPSCGDLCHDYRAATEKAARAELQSSAFGMEDFISAIRYPFNHKTALFTGAVIYALLLLAGFRGTMVAGVVLFGCISQAITQVAWGRFNRSFMPDFSSFSIVDDFVVPIFLGLGIMIVSWGPVIVLVLALLFGAIGGGSHKNPAPFAPAAASAGPSKEDLDVITDPNADPARLAEANQKLQETRPGAAIAREAEASKAAAANPLGPYADLFPSLAAGLSIIVLLLALIAWAVFYYPMALTVAGYTQSFSSVINPLVGLDTIRRMGITYLKAFAMVILVQIASTVVSVVVSFLTSPFALPFMGNIIGGLISATFSFYFNLVVACILGLSLFKSADRLGIAVD